MEYILDSVWGAGGIQTYGTETLEIINLVYPSSVEPGVGFQVTYSARNNSAAVVNAYGYVINTQTGTQYGYWEQPVAVGGSHPSVVNMVGISSTFYGEVRIGHIEGPVTCINPSGADGDFVCGNPAYGNAPVEGRRYECTPTGWTDLGVDPVNCPIGAEVVVTVPTPPVEQGSVTGAGAYSPGELVTLVAYPAVGYTFAGWTGDVTGSSSTLQFYMPDHDITVNANFRLGAGGPNWMMIGAMVAVVSVVGIVFLVGKR